MSTARKMTQQAQELQAQFDLLHEKITRLRKAVAIEVNPAAKFQWETELKDAEAEREQVEWELQWLEQQPETPEDLPDAPTPPERAFPLRYALISLVVVAIGGLVWWLSMPETKPFPMTVFLHNSTGPIPDNGQVILTLGGAVQEAPIEKNGDAHFRQIPANFRNQAVPVAIKAAGFELAEPDKQYSLTGEHIEVEIRCRPIKFFGKIVELTGDAQQPLAGVRVLIGNASAITNADGYFELALRPEKPQATYSFTATKIGYAPYSLNKVQPGSTINLILKKE